MAHGRYKDLTKRTQSDKFLRNRAYKIVYNPNHNDYERALVSMIYRFFEKKTKGSGIKNESKEN